MFTLDIGQDMMLDTLLQNELVQLAIAIGSGFAAFFAVVFGLKSPDRRKTKYDVNHEILKKLQLMHEDIIRIANDLPNVQLARHDIAMLDGRVVDLAKTIAVMFDTESKTFDKVDNIETIVQIIKALNRRSE